MKMSRQVALQILGCCCLCGTMPSLGVHAEQAAQQAAQPAVAVVVGAMAPELERYAAGKLCRYLEQLYEIRTTPAEQVPTDAAAICLLGSPTSNHLIAQAVGPRGWPKLSDQGLVLKRVVLDGKPAMIVGGDKAMMKVLPS
jgi:hypothetical protein